MKIAVWKTGHHIADTVAEAFRHKCSIVSDAILNDYLARGVILDKHEVNLVYGILRGADRVIKEARHSFNIDNGYFNPGHFDGYYRISYRGTQAKWHENIPKQDIEFELEDWKPATKYILICPPTEPVKQFFGIDWIPQVKDASTGYVYQWRDKNTASLVPIDWDKVGGVITFNSSVGWEALRRGIPCISDTTHSIVGSYYKHELDKLNLDYTFDNVLKVDRRPLFEAMRAHQFTLAEIREGRAWQLLKHYLQT